MKNGFLVLLFLIVAGAARAAGPEPYVGQPGKDVVWVPTPDALVAAKRGASAGGVEGRVHFLQGDMYEADISRATVLALFLLPHNLEVLKPKFEWLRPGTRIVVNGYEAPAGRQSRSASSAGTAAPGAPPISTSFPRVTRHRR